ncbi:MAG: arsenite methyltransferase [Caldilineales bacterium]|nr:arsenite methyltransferase [Caldilineales bacterium]
MTTDTPNIKEQVRERYAAIAVQGTSCCGTNAAQDARASVSFDPAVDMQFSNYDVVQLEVVEGSDLGLGCGTPTQYARLQPGETVLDLGSGAGIDVFLAAKAVGNDGKVIGVDMTPEMIERARSNAARSKLTNVEFRLGELESLPVVDDTVDVALSNCVINLTPDKAVTLRELYRVLKPGGRFSISDMVTFGPVPDAIRTDMALWTGCIAGAMDRDEYLALFRSIGFRDVRIESESQYGSSWLPEDRRLELAAELDGEGEDFGAASVTIVGYK